jgi:hypothetical protein
MSVDFDSRPHRTHGGRGFAYVRLKWQLESASRNRTTRFLVIVCANKTAGMWLFFVLTLSLVPLNPLRVCYRQKLRELLNRTRDQRDEIIRIPRGRSSGRLIKLEIDTSLVEATILLSPNFSFRAAGSCAVVGPKRTQAFFVPHRKLEIAVLISATRRILHWKNTCRVKSG